MSDPFNESQCLCAFGSGSVCTARICVNRSTAYSHGPARLRPQPSPESLKEIPETDFSAVTRTISNSYAERIAKEGIHITIQPDTRPSRDEIWMNVAREVTRLATCPRKHVGAVIVKDGIIVSTGYNGAPKDQPHCTEVGCLLVEVAGRQSCQRTLHAEQNAILRASPQDRMGATMYCTLIPCAKCALEIIGSGIARIVVGDADYPVLHAREMLEQAGILVEVLPKKEENNG